MWVRKACHRFASFCVARVSKSCRALEAVPEPLGVKLATGCVGGRGPMSPTRDGGPSEVVRRFESWAGHQPEGNGCDLLFRAAALSWSADLRFRNRPGRDEINNRMLRSSAAARKSTRWDRQLGRVRGADGFRLRDPPRTHHALWWRPRHRLRRGRGGMQRRGSGWHFRGTPPWRAMRTGGVCCDG